MKSRSKKTFFLLPIIFFGLFVMLIWSRITAPVTINSSQEVLFTIDKGESIDKIAANLKEKNLIRSIPAFKLIIMQLNLSKKIQAGDFQISPSWSLKKIVNTLTVGRSDVKVTLIEGWRMEEIADEIALQLENSNFNQQEFIRLAEDKEGYLFPDTYFFPKNTNTLEAMQILLDNFESKVDQSIKDTIQNQGLSLEKAIIIASLVEREAKFDKDRPLVAGIIFKRLQNKWPLEIDATVQYLLGYQRQSESWWKKELTRKDLEIQSPYNTYQNQGLPPAPICNPSLSSIEAVAYYTPSDYWFYISDSKGNLHYAKTLDEHNQNIKTYLGK